MTLARPSPKSSWLSVVVAGALAIVGQTIAVNVIPAQEDGARALRFTHIAAAIVALALSFALRRRWRQRLAMSLFIVVIAPLYMSMWLFHGPIPLQAAGFLLFLLAVLIPGAPWVNMLLMAAFAVEAIYIGRTRDIAGIPYQGWTITLYWIAAVCLLSFRTVHDHLARELERTRSRAQMLEEMARMFLTLRDRMNTPLQTLKVAVAILDTKAPGTDALAETMSRSIDRITDLNATLSLLESRVAFPRAGLMTAEEIAKIVQDPHRSDDGTSEK